MGGRYQLLMAFVLGAILAIAITGIASLVAEHEDGKTAAVTPDLTGQSPTWSATSITCCLIIAIALLVVLPGARARRRT